MHPSDQQDIRDRLLVARLPAMPQTLIKLIELCQSDEAGMNELADLIGSDVAMMTKVLNTANSAAYHRGGPKVGLVQALSTLGADMIKLLVISESVFQTFNAFPHSASTDLRHFWQHALSTAVMARAIAKKMAYPLVEEAYLAGLLHDVGRLALLAAAPIEYSVNFKAQDNATLCNVEQRSLQISHTEAGAWLIGRWNLGSALADSVLYHHETAKRIALSHPLIRIVHLADRLANHTAEQPVEVDAGALCDIDDQHIAAIMLAVDAQVKKAAEDLGIELPVGDPIEAPQAVFATPDQPDTGSQRLAQEVRDMALTTAVGQSLAKTKDDGHLLEMIRHNAHILLNLNDSLLFLTNEEGLALVKVSPTEPMPAVSELAIPLGGTGRIAQAARLRNLVFLGPERGVLSPDEEQLRHLLDAECLVCVPIATTSACWGMIIGSVAPWRLTELKQRERFLLAFGLQAALSLQNAANIRQEIDRRIATVRQENLEDSRRVAHEINNPLAIIQNYLTVLDQKLHRQEAVSGELSILKEEISRVGHLIDEFAGGTPKVQGRATEVAHVIQDLVHLFSESKFLPASVKIIATAPGRSSEIEGTADALKQILINLLKNAIEAIPDGGCIEISNSGVLQLEGRDYIEVSVKDSGPGMSLETQSQLFAPLRSAKAGQNRGLGLSIVHRLVEKLGGLIRCQSSSAGTTFTVLLPACASLARRAEPLPSSRMN